MMATTEPESIPQTIRSRCQHFSFHAVKFDDIFAQLKAIAEKENVVADDAALALLAEAGDGSMRDALSIMDQAIASAPVEDGRAVLQTEQIRELMGSVPNAVFERLMEAVSAQQSAMLMIELDRLISSGNSPSALSRQLVRYLRNCLMAKLGGENTQLLEIAQDERARAARTAVLFTEDELTRNLQIALRTFDELNEYQEHRFHLELGLLKLIQAQKLLPVEEILSGLASQNPRVAAAVSGAALRPAQAPQAVPRSTTPATPSLSPFAPSTQRATEVPLSSPVSRPIRDVSSLSVDREPVAMNTPAVNPPLLETATTGALALAEPEAVSEREPSPIEAHAESGPQIVPALVPAVAPMVAAASGSGDVGEIRTAVVEALSGGGHSTAAVLVEDGQWTLDGSSVRIAVNAKPTMIRITFNAAAEKLIRQGLTQVGAPGRFLIVPAEGLAVGGGMVRSGTRAPLGSIENEARSNPLVIQAQALFNAEIVSVVDLRKE